MERVIGEIDHGGNMIRDLKRKRDVGCAAYLADIGRGKKNLTDRKKGLMVSAAADSLGHGCGCCSGKTMINNYSNFHKSALPKRLMFFSKGEWVDFPAHAVDPLVNAFGGNRSAVEVVLDRCLYLIDFLRMVRVNLKSGVQQSIAWIDESERCFFPKCFFDGSDIKDGGRRKRSGRANAPEIEVKLEIDISGAGSSDTQDASDPSVSHERTIKVQNSPIAYEHSDIDQDSGAIRNQPLEMKEGTGDNGYFLPEGGASARGISNMDEEMPEIFCSDALRDKVVSLDRGSGDYAAVRDVFLMGLGTSVTASHIVGIYRCSPISSSSQARMQLFASQSQIMKNYRGDANLRYAWYGSSRENILQIMLHGFKKIRKPMNGAVYGNGISLSPKECSHISAAYSDVDEKGLQHMVLCRVIMGNMEKVSSGSKQFCPSSENFDSGVDDIRNPKHYIIWGTHMDIHILPEYVVSFKVPLSLQEYWAGLKESQSTVGSVAVTKSRLPDDHVKSVAPTADLGNAPEAVKKPNSNWMPFPLLFAAIDEHISGGTRKHIDCYYDAFKSKRMTREEFIKRLRLLVGDDLLIATLKNLQPYVVGADSTVGSPLGDPGISSPCRFNSRSSVNGSFPEK